MHPAQQFRKLIHKFTYKFYFLIYSISWEQRKLGHVFVEYSEKGHPELPALTIIQGGGTVRRDESERSLQYDKASLANYKMVNAEDFIVHLRSFEGGLEKATTLGIISPAYHTFHGEGTDSRFYYSYFRSKRFIEQDLKPHVYGIRDGRSIDIEGMKTIEIPWTSYTEQQVIGNYIDTMDNLITLHQRKLEKLKNIKKSMLEKMFPRDGSKFPEIRFSGFTDPWEQRKFSDITFPAGEKNKDNLPLESYSITNEHGFVPQDEKFENGGTMREADKRMYYIVSPNSFAYNPARINVGSIGYQNIGKNVIVSSLYEVFKTSEDVDDRLLWHWFKSPDFQKLIMQLQEGGVRLYFYYDKLCMGEVSLPSLEEQRKIGKLFDTLDNLITLHQRKPYIHKKEDFQC